MMKSDKGFLYLLLLSVIVVIAATAYTFLHAKDYNFSVEAECDPETETCFYRDCSEEDVCPPNNLENYRIFMVSAKDFPTCSDNSCLAECSEGKLICEEIKCGESEEDVCAVAGGETEESTE